MTQASTALPRAPEEASGYCIASMLSTMAKGLFRLACDNDLYLAEQANWLKVRNRIYSQWLWREELFERSAEPTPTSTIGMIVSLHVKASKCEPSLPEEISHVIRKAGTVEKDLLQSAPPRIRNLDLPPRYPMKCRLR